MAHEDIPVIIRDEGEKVVEVREIWERNYVATVERTEGASEEFYIPVRMVASPDHGEEMADKFIIESINLSDQMPEDLKDPIFKAVLHELSVSGIDIAHMDNWA